jgi:hypothetical protein
MREGIERLTEYPTNGEPRCFITIHEGIGGWNSGMWCWTDMTEEDPDFKMEDGSTGFYEPWNTGFTNTSLGDGQRASAIAEAESWADAEELPIYLPECRRSAVGCHICPYKGQKPCEQCKDCPYS